MKTIRFEVPVNCKLPFSDEVRPYADSGLIMLPKSYSDTGEPTRLVINCHGAGGTVTTNDSQVEHQEFTQYLLANGYAVMDTNGLPYQLAEEFGIDLRNNIGSPIAVDCYVTAYNYCMEHFNLKPDVFVHGGSMGGISSNNLVLSERIPVIANSALCPVLDAYNQVFLHPWSGGLPKTAEGILYSFEKDENGEWIYDAEKLRGFDPMTSTKKHPCPVWFCHSENDNVVNPEYTKRYIARAKDQGVDAQLLLFPDGFHEPQTYGDPVKDPTGIAVLDGEEITITLAVEHAFRWIREHEPTL